LTLIIDQRKVADRGRAPPAIEEAFDEAEHRRARRSLVLETLATEQFAFSVAKKLSPMALS
jgi:hypothetical protein